PQLAGAAFLLDARFVERAAAFLAPGAVPSLASPSGKEGGRPAKSLVSVAALVHRDGSLPAAVAALPEAEDTRRVTLAWIERSEWASGRQTARNIARIMVENLK